MKIKDNDRLYRLTEESFLELDCCSVTYIMDQLQAILDEKGPSATIWKDFYGYDGAYNLMVQWERDETVAEVDARLKAERELEEKERKKAKALETKEMAEYVRLKAKFGPKMGDE